MCMKQKGKKISGGFVHVCMCYITKKKIVIYNTYIIGSSTRRQQILYILANNYNLTKYPSTMCRNFAMQNNISQLLLPTIGKCGAKSKKYHAQISYNQLRTSYTKKPNSKKILIITLCNIKYIHTTWINSHVHSARKNTTK